MLKINQATEEQVEEMYKIADAFRVTNYKISPEQLDVIEKQLTRASWILNYEDVPDWEDLQEACRGIADALAYFRIIREKVK